MGSTSTSAVLLAAHFEILETVERALGPIHIPYGLPLALGRIEHDLVLPQPARIAALREIEHLIASGTLAVRSEVSVEPWCAITTALAEDMGERWTTTVTRAHAEAALVVGFMPPRRVDLKQRPRDLSSEVEAVLIGSGDVASALHRLGVLSSVAAEAAQQVSGAPTGSASAAQLTRGASLLLDVGLTSVLAEAGILDAACRAFKVSMDRLEHQHVAQELAAADTRTSLARWVAGISARIRVDLERGEGRYVRCPSAGDAVADKQHFPDPATRALVEALAPADLRLLPWVDDRAIASRGSQIVGIYDVLHALWQRKIIDDKKYFETLLRIRRARVYFIPTDTCELIYWLDQAATSGDELTETEELATIRRYFATAVDAGLLVFPDHAGGDDHRELPFVLRLSQAIQEALAEIWGSARPTALKEALSEWLWISFSIHEVRGIPPGAREPRPELFVLRLVTLTLVNARGALPIEGPRTDGAFSNWLDARLLAERLDVDPGVHAQVVGHFREHLGQLLSQVCESPTDYSHAWRLTVGRYADALPSSVREALQQDAELMAAVGRAFKAVISVESWEFPVPEAWPDFVRALDLGYAETRTADDQVARLEASRDADGSWVVTITTDGEPFPWRHRLLGLLARDIHDREIALRACRGAFDCSNAEFELLLADVVTLPDPGARIEHVNRWTDASSEVHYRSLHDKLRARASLERSDLSPPPIDRLLGRLRLPRTPPAADVAKQLDQAAIALLEDLSVRGALARLSALPVPLPSPVVRAVEDLDPVERRAILTAHNAESVSPLPRLHSVWLLLRFADGDEMLALAKAQLEWLATHGIDAMRTDVELASAALDHLHRQHGLTTWSAGQRLIAAWAHASHLDTILRAAGAPEDWMRGLAPFAIRGVPAEWLIVDRELLNDVAAPSNVEPVAAVVFGLAYALSADRTRAAEVWPALRTPLVEAATRVAANGTHHPLQDFFRCQATAANTLGTFLAWWPEIADVLGEGLSILPTPELVEGLVRGAVDKIEADPSCPESWAPLVVLQRSLPMPETLAARVSAVVPRLDAEQFTANSDNVPVLAQVLLFACAQRGLGHLRLDDAVTRVLLSRVARRFGQLSDINDPRRIEADVLEACRLTAIVAGDTEESARRLAELFRVVVDAWPALGKRCRELTQVLCDRLPVAQGKWLWTLLTYLRTLP